MRQDDACKDVKKHDNDLKKQNTINSNQCKYRKIVSVSEKNYRYRIDIVNDDIVSYRYRFF